MSDGKKFTPDKPKDELSPLQRFAKKLFGPADEAIAGKSELQKELEKEKVPRGR